MKIKITILFLITIIYLVNCSKNNILLLGSGGVIGSSLKIWLNNNNYNIIEVRNRKHIDLRLPNTLNQFNNQSISFAFFLACEVGGSKFLESKEKSKQLIIVENNILIYQNVFNWLKIHNIPFIFTSSYLQPQANSYGTIKRLGEKWIEGLGIGKIARLWNVYGAEPIGEKSHVLGDWVSQCINNNKIYSRTNGKEARQFLSASDCANALGTMMQLYDKLELVTDLSVPQWISLRSVAKIIIKNKPSCTIEYNDQSALAKVRLAPNIDTLLHKHWSPKKTLEDGVKELFNYYDKNLSKKKKHEDEL